MVGRIDTVRQQIEAGRKPTSKKCLGVFSSHFAIRQIENVTFEMYYLIAG